MYYYDGFCQQANGGLALSRALKAQRAAKRAANAKMKNAKTKKR